MKRYSNYRSSSSSYTPRSMRRLQKSAQKHFIWYLVGAGVVGYFLIFWVLPFLVGGLTYFNRYKEVEQVDNVVEDTAVAPPVLTIPYEATNTAVIRVKGFATVDGSVEIYVGNDLKDTVSTSSDGSFEAEIPLSDGVNAIYGKTVIDKKTSLPSKAIRINFSDQKPKLEVSQPSDNQEITGGDKKVKVEGITDPENNVTVNNAYIIVNNEGKFSTEVSLNDGDNQITITAVNEYGSNTSLQKTVKYTP